MTLESQILAESTINAATPFAEAAWYGKQGDLGKAVYIVRFSGAGSLGIQETTPPNKSILIIANLSDIPEPNYNDLIIFNKGTIDQEDWAVIEDVEREQFLNQIVLRISRADKRKI